VPAVRHGELFEQGIPLAQRHPLENGDHLQSGREGSPCPIRYGSNEAAIGVDRYGTPQRPFLQQFLDGGGGQIGHYVALQVLAAMAARLGHGTRGSGAFYKAGQIIQKIMAQTKKTITL